MKMASAWCLVFVIFLAAFPSFRAQDTSCLTQLIPCLNYLNSTSSNPPSNCCDPLKEVIKSNPQCICNLVTSNAGATQGGTININQAVALPARCGLNVNLASCTAGSPESPNSGSGSPRSPTGSSPDTRTTQESSASSFSIMGIMMIAILPLILQITWEF